MSRAISPPSKPQKRISTGAWIITAAANGSPLSGRTNGLSLEPCCNAPLPEAIAVVSQQNRRRRLASGPAKMAAPDKSLARNNKSTLDGGWPRPGQGSRDIERWRGYEQARRE